MSAVSILGLLFEIILFGCGVYVYLYARGFVTIGQEETRARAEAWRKENATWMRILGLALAALMAVNIALHVGDVMGGGG